MKGGTTMSEELNIVAEEKKSSTEEKKKMNLFQKLLEIRKTVLYVSKGDTGHNFKYANTADLLAVIRPVMDEVGVLLVSNMESFERLQPKGIQITMSYTWINAENPEEKSQTMLTFHEERMTGCQGVGSVLTYGERYFLYKAFLVATDEDAPEKFYKKHGLSAIEEEQPKQAKQQKEENKAVPKAPLDYRRTIEAFEKVSPKIWEEMQKVDESIKDITLKEKLPYYLFFTQSKHPNVDIIVQIKNQIKDPQQIVRSINAWYDHANGDSLMEELQWAKAQESYREQTA